MGSQTHMHLTEMQVSDSVEGTYTQYNSLTHGGRCHRLRMG
jgi:hypothetical protein